MKSRVVKQYLQLYAQNLHITEYKSYFYTLKSPYPFDHSTEQLNYLYNQIDILKGIGIGVVGVVAYALTNNCNGWHMHLLSNSPLQEPLNLYDSSDLWQKPLRTLQGSIIYFANQSKLEVIYLEDVPPEFPISSPPILHSLEDLRETNYNLVIQTPIQILSSSKGVLKSLGETIFLFSKEKRKIVPIYKEIYFKNTFMMYQIFTDDS